MGYKFCEVSCAIIPGDRKVYFGCHDIMRTMCLKYLPPDPGMAKRIIPMAAISENDIAAVFRSQLSIRCAAMHG